MAADTLIVNTGNIGRLFVEFLAGRGTEIVHRSQKIWCAVPQLPKRRIIAAGYCIADFWGNTV